MKDDPRVICRYGNNSWSRDDVSKMLKGISQSYPRLFSENLTAKARLCCCKLCCCTKRSSLHVRLCKTVAKQFLCCKSSEEAEKRKEALWNEEVEKALEGKELEKNRAQNVKQLVEAVKNVKNVKNLGSNITNEPIEINTW
eukprot:SAG11_NODE_12645_length_693_cov_0.668350_1_plen_140_part_10